MNIAEIVFPACFLIALTAAYWLFRGYHELFQLDRGIQLLPPEVPAQHQFDGKTQGGRLAAGYVALFSRAASRNMLGSFQVDRAASPLLAYLRSIANLPRNLVGVLILGGLLVTLFNLQGSVGLLGGAFTDLAKSQATTQNPPEGAPPQRSQSPASPDTADQSIAQIQKAMGDIARTAQTTFLRSGVVIFMAAVILFVAMVLQYRGQVVSRSFVAWANVSYIEALAARPMDQQAQMEKLGELVDKMGELTQSFAGISEAMATVGDFGAKLDASSQMVAEAVSQLPATINSSVVQLSAEVTRDISVHLEHQVEHIKRLLMVYGDQEIRVRKIQEYLDGFSKSLDTSFKAASTLVILPDSLNTLSETIKGMTTTSKTMVTTSEQLGAKLMAAVTLASDTMITTSHNLGQKVDALPAAMMRLDELAGSASRGRESIMGRLFRSKAAE